MTSSRLLLLFAVVTSLILPQLLHAATTGYGDQVFYIGSNQHIYQNVGSCTVNSSPPPDCTISTLVYTPVDLTTLSGGPLPTANSPLAEWNLTTAPQVYFVLYIGADQHIHALFQNPGSSWSFEDLTSIAGAPITATNSSLSTIVLSNQPHVYYIGADSHVHEIYRPASTFVTVDMTAAAGARNAVSGSGLASWVGGAFDLVYYQTADGHVNELYSRDGGATWANTDVTVAAGAPIGVIGTRLDGYEHGRFSFVYFFGGDFHVHVLHTANSEWVTEDATSLSGAPVAVNTVSLGAFTMGGWELAYFLTGDGHIHEVYSGNSGSSWGTTDVTSAASAPVAGADSSLLGVPSSFVSVSGFELYYVGQDALVRLLYVNSVPQWTVVGAGSGAASSESSLAFLSSTAGP
jgi:hypothetical protein